MIEWVDERGASKGAQESESSLSFFFFKRQALDSLAYPPLTTGGHTKSFSPPNEAVPQATNQ